jgi:hypothetical protein
MKMIRKTDKEMLFYCIVIMAFAYGYDIIPHSEKKYNLLPGLES